MRDLLVQGDEELLRAAEEEAALLGEACSFNDSFDALLHHMAENPAYGGEVSGVAKTLLAYPDQTRSTIVGFLKTGIGHLKDAKVQYLLQGSDFKLSDLKLKPTTLYFCASGLKLADELRPIAAVFVDMALRAMEETPTKPNNQVLFVIDEFNALGRLPRIEGAMWTRSRPFIPREAMASRTEYFSVADTLPLFLEYLPEKLQRCPICRGPRQARH